MKKIIILLLVMIAGNLFSQEDAIILDKLISDDSSSVSVLFNYPDSIRTVIFKASAYPQGFIRLDEVQKNTAASFQKTASKYSREKQEQLWNLARYPELIPYLIQNRDKAGSGADDFLKRYPSKTQAAAIDFAKHEYEALQEIQNIRSVFETKYKEVIHDFPTEVKNAFNTLLKFPEIIDILSGNMKTTVTLGDIYKRDPDLLKRKSDSLNLEMAKQKAIEYEDWKKAVSADTAAGKELKNISAEYTAEQSAESGSFSEAEYTLIISNNYAPYPYWCGYPHWYGAPHWYPYPWWYQCGYYWPGNGTIVFIGLPTYYFGWWYFHHPHHHYYYPRASNHFYHHYEGHRRSSSGLAHSVREWEGRSRNSLRADWLKDDAGRIDRFKEYGSAGIKDKTVNRSPPGGKTAPKPIQKPARQNKPVKKPAQNTRPVVKPAPRPVTKPQPQPKVQRKPVPSTPKIKSGKQNDKKEK